MTYSFKDAVVAKLPKGHTYVRMYSTCSEETAVEVLHNGVPKTLTMPKINISKLFLNLPVFFVGSTETFNDLYKGISDKYGLGLVNGIDYYDPNKVEPTEFMRYVDLPLLKDSHGYYGSIRCYVIKGTKGITSPGIQKDLTNVGQDIGTALMRLRSYGMCSVHTDRRPIFIRNRLSVGFIDSIVNKIESNGEANLASYCRTALIQAVVIDYLNDGLSDLILLRLDTDETLFIRFKSEKGDLPVLIENNGDNDVETDNSKEGLVGDDVDLSNGDGDYNYTEEILPLGNNDDLPIPSSGLPEGSDLIDEGEITISNDKLFEEKDITVEL